jgi:hypothetical protein
MRRSRAATATRPIRNGAGIRRRGFETLLCKVKPGGHILIGSRGSCLRRRGNAVDPPLLLGRGGAPENTGNFVRLGFRVRLLAQNSGPNSTVYDAIPYASEQGIYFALAGN